MSYPGGPPGSSTDAGPSVASSRPTPAGDASVVDGPVVEPSAAEASSVVDRPVVDGPVVQASAGEASSVVDRPVVDRPVVDRPVVAPSAGETASVVDQSVVSPSADDAPADDMSAVDPAAVDPAAADPSVLDSSQDGRDAVDAGPELPATGDRQVDEAIEALLGVVHRPLADQVAVYADVHGRLQDRLADLDG
jgi:hypothetical protein